MLHRIFFSLVPHRSSKRSSPAFQRGDWAYKGMAALWPPAEEGAGFQSSRRIHSRIASLVREPAEGTLLSPVAGEASCRDHFPFTTPRFQEEGSFALPALPDQATWQQLTSSVRFLILSGDCCSALSTCSSPRNAPRQESSCWAAADLHSFISGATNKTWSRGVLVSHTSHIPERERL